MRVLLLGYCLSAVLMKQFTVAALSAKCSEVAADLTNVDCEGMMNFKNSGKDVSKCVNKIVESKSIRNDQKYKSFHKLIYQYCRDAGGGNTACNICFDKALQDHWNQHFCLKFNKYRVQEVKTCRWEHPNQNFGWSHNIIFKSYHETVDLSNNIYRGCQTELISSLLKSGSTFSFPIKLDLQEDEMDAYMTVYLSFFLDALKNSGNHPEYLSCNDIVNSGILKTFRIQTDVNVKAVPNKIKQSYSNLRNNMCSNSSDSKLCKDCFNKVDNTFLFHLYNWDHKISAVVGDFGRMHVDLTNCIKNHTEGIYYSVIDLANNYIPPWKAGFFECSNEWSSVYNEMFSKHPQKVWVYGKNLPIVKIVAANYHSFRIYMDLFRNDYKRMCQDVKNSEIMCSAVKVVQATEIKKDEDDETRQLAYNLQLCGNA